MPLYEYHCPTCSYKFEKLQPMNATGADCPNCEQPAKRAISMFAKVGNATEDVGFNPGPLPPMGGGGCCAGGCGCGH